MRHYVDMITLLGKRTKEALETLKCAQALDAFQDGRHLGKSKHRHRLDFDKDIIYGEHYCHLISIILLLN